MEVTYLPLRAFGDFMITASVVKDNFIRRIPIVLPTYFEAIFEAIGGEKYFDVVDSITYNNQPAYFELYKAKDLKNIKRLLHDIRTLKNSINKNQTYLVDYSSKRLLWINRHLIWPARDKNVYEGRFTLLNSKGLITKDNAQNRIHPLEPGKSKRILLLPDSRIATKSINPDLVKTIVKKISHVEVVIGCFGQPENTLPGTISYSNFHQLIGLISAYDMVISAESLPYHLANYLSMPHFVIYNQSRHSNSTFMTKFMLDNKYYAVFNGVNTHQVVEQLAAILQPA
jgi:ADP-heptose:LPS heptosyltransferase